MPPALSPDLRRPTFAVPAREATARAASSIVLRQQVVGGAFAPDKGVAARLQQFAFLARDSELYLQATAALQPESPTGSPAPLAPPELWPLGDEAYERRDWPAAASLWRAARRFCGGQDADLDELREHYEAPGLSATRRAGGLLHVNELQEDRIGSLMSSTWSQDRLDHLLTIDPAYVPALLLRAAVAVQVDEFEPANRHLARAFAAGEALGLRRELDAPALTGAARPWAADWTAVAAWWLHQPLIQLTAALVWSYEPASEALALQRMEELANSESESGLSWELLGRAYEHARRWPDAEGAWRRVLLKPVHSIDAFMRLGCVLDRRGATAEAERLFERYVAAALNVAEAQHALGMRLMATHDEAPLRAMAAFRAALADGGGGPDCRIEAAANLGNALRRLGRPEEGILLLQQALRVPGGTGNRVVVLLALARAQWDAKDTVAALQTYEEAAAADPENVDLLEELAQRLGEIGCVDQAVVYWRRLCLLQPQEQIFVRNLGRCLLLSEPEQAIEPLEEACRVHGDNATVLCLLAGAAAALGERLPALLYYERALEADPGAMANTIVEVSRYFYRAQWFDLGLRLVEDGLRQQPHHAELCQRKAIFFIEQADLVQARVWLRKALAIDPKDIEYWQLLRATLDTDDASDAVEALDCLRNLSRLQPQDGEAALDLARALLRAERLGEARAASQRAVWLMPDDSFAHHALANTLYRLGEAAEACLSMRRAIDLEPDNEILPASYGAMLMDAGRDVEALEWLMRAQKLDPESQWVRNNLSILRSSSGHI